MRVFSLNNSNINKVFRLHNVLIVDDLLALFPAVPLTRLELQSRKDRYLASPGATSNLIRHKAGIALIHINLTGALISSGIIEYAAENLDRLKSLIIGRSQGYLETALLQAFKRLTKLRHFEVVGNTFFTGRSLDQAATHISSLELEGCFFLNKDHLIEFIKDNQKRELIHQELRPIQDKIRGAPQYVCIN